MRGEVLIVDDEINAIKVLSAILTDEGYTIEGASSVEMALEFLRQKDFDCIITDLRMPDKDGMYLFEQINQYYPDIPVIFLTAYGTVESAVSALRLGAFYYFIKPPDYIKLKEIVSKAVEEKRFKRKFYSLSDEHAFIGESSEMKKVLNVIKSIKDSTCNVLVCGETGTGKELVARLIHFTSSRKNKPFVAVNCAAIPKELLESELFGHERGAFTGAISRRIGRFEEVASGTLLLDEIGELDFYLQAKLLRVLQEKEIERLGSNKKISVDFRLICSTNRDLELEVKKGNFRQDLYYRINVVQITLPPLRARTEDIPLLAELFLKQFSLKENKHLTFSKQVLDIFKNYHWPGNVRQLRNVIERAVVLAKGDEITIRDLPREIVCNKDEESQQCNSLKDLELLAIRDTLLKCRGNKSRAARLLGISRKTLYKRLNELSLMFPKETSKLN
ncbi:MAG: sigma-54 dependent transcriptional regulator [Thermodesulfovibrionales bacterium]|nr:sigma-54 dependent transcriptional regulator [Thermodesulfovibrionales bacterium]